jgi:ribonucleoside-diphosphate reductase beta chain
MRLAELSYFLDVASQWDAPFAGATADPQIQALLAIQEGDEERHARFFDRVVEEVLGVPGEGPDGRREALRGDAPPELRELFEVVLPERSTAVADGAEDLVGGIGLYHMVLEGVVLVAGQFALIRELDRVGGLPGTREGVELVHRDERWHIGFGARCLQDARPSEQLIARMLEEGAVAADAWGDAVPGELVDRMRGVLRRRLRAAGLVPREMETATHR